MDYLTKCEKMYNELKPKIKGFFAISNVEIENEMAKFEEFLHSEAEDACFEGFDFVTIFHYIVKKEEAIYACESDDVADAITPFGTFHVGADGVMVYFFSKTPKKLVRFNRSVYFF